MLKASMLRLGVGALAVIGSSFAAQAANAVATGAVNVRTGPGTQYGVLNQLQRGQPVDVRQCSAGWCYVVAAGPDGWVSARYLSGGGGYVIRRQPQVTFNFGFGVNPRVHVDDNDYSPPPPSEYPGEEPMPWPPEGGEEPMPWPPQDGEYAPPPSSEE